MALLARCTAAALLLTACAAYAGDPLWVGVFENPEQTREGVDAAIETGVEKMNFVKRAVARGRLKKTNPAYKRIAIERTADVVRVQFDDRTPIEMPLDGKPIQWKRDDGEVFDVSAAVRDDALVQTFKAEDGERVNTFTANAAGQMTMESRISSPQLPVPVIYTLLYERRSGG